VLKRITLAKRTCLPPDPIDEIFTQIPSINEKRLAAGLPAIINLSVGEPHLNINPAVLQDFIQLLTQRVSGNQTSLTFNYSPPSGNEATLEAISALYNHYYPNLHFSSQEVMISNGATQGIWNALNILIDIDDEVLIFEPYYSTYDIQIRTLGGKLVRISTQKNNFKPSGKLLHDALSMHPNAKALILNYPNNPTGIDLTKHETVEIVEILQHYPNVSIIIDDVYRELTYAEHYTVLDIDPSLKNRSIIVNSASKGLIGAPGIRAGMVGANAEWIKQMINIQALSVCSISCFTEQVLVAGIKHKLASSNYYNNWINESKHAYFINKQYVAQQLISLGFHVIAGEHGFFILAASNITNHVVPDDILFQSENGKAHVINNLHQKLGSKILHNDRYLAAYLLHIAGIAVVPGSAFGIDEHAGYLRFSCAKPLNDLKLAISNIKIALQYLSTRNIDHVSI
jgi:aspartate/methionine/tyrosine aminotransferase